MKKHLTCMSALSKIKKSYFHNPEKFQIPNFEQKCVQTNFQMVFLLPSNHFLISAVYTPQQCWRIAQPFGKMSCQY